MLKKISPLIILFILLGCNEDKSEEQKFILNGNIKGLKKGTVYLQAENDSALVTVDSMIVNGETDFVLKHHLEEPEMLYLRLNKNDDDESIVSFFADTGVTTISSTLKNFIYDVKIDGSNQQKLLEEYLEIMSKFNDNNLDLIKKSFETRATADSVRINEVETEFNNLLRRKYLYTINFAFSNNNSEVAPYLAISQIPDANTKFLDTIYNGLTENIKESKYGLKLKQLLENRKEN